MVLITQREMVMQLVISRVSDSHLDRHLIVLFSGLGEFTHNELFQDPKTYSCLYTLENKRV